MNRSFKLKITVVFLLLSVGIGQLIFVIFARSSLIWTYHPSSLSSAKMVHLPKNTLNPRKYLFVFTAKHVFIGSYSGGNITLRNLSTGQEIDFQFALSSSITLAAKDSQLLDIPSGNYEISVDSFPNVLYYIELYMNGIFNSDGSPTFFPETTAILTSVVILLVLLISSLGLIVHIRKAVINFKSKTGKRKPSN